MAKHDDLISGKTSLLKLENKFLPKADFIFYLLIFFAVFNGFRMNRFFGGVMEPEVRHFGLYVVFEAKYQ